MISIILVTITTIKKTVLQPAVLFVKFSAPEIGIVTKRTFPIACVLWIENIITTYSPVSIVSSLLNATIRNEQGVVVTTIKPAAITARTFEFVATSSPGKSIIIITTLTYVIKSFSFSLQTFFSSTLHSLSLQLSSCILPFTQPQYPQSHHIFTFYASKTQDSPMLCPCFIIATTTSTIDMILAWTAVFRPFAIVIRTRTSGLCCYTSTILDRLTAGVIAISLRVFDFFKNTAISGISPSGPHHCHNIHQFRIIVLTHL